MMSAIERCPLFLSAVKRFFNETVTMIVRVMVRWHSQKPSKRSVN